MLCYVAMDKIWENTGAGKRVLRSNYSNDRVGENLRMFVLQMKVPEIFIKQVLLMFWADQWRDKGLAVETSNKEVPGLVTSGLDTEE